MERSWIETWFLSNTFFSFLKTALHLNVTELLRCSFFWGTECGRSLMKDAHLEQCQHLISSRHIPMETNLKNGGISWREETLIFKRKVKIKNDFGVALWFPSLSGCTVVCPPPHTQWGWTHRCGQRNVEGSRTSAQSSFPLPPCGCCGNVCWKSLSSSWSTNISEHWQPSSGIEHEWKTESFKALVER